MKIGRRDMERLIEEHRLTCCFECGKCTASCPMAEFFGDVEFGATPRGIIEKALLDADLVTGDAIWYCLTCDVCTKGCPAGVRFRDFIEGLRKLVIDAGHDQYGARCRRCGSFFLPTITQRQLLVKLRFDQNGVDFLFFCPSCRRRIGATNRCREKRSQLCWCQEKRS